MTPVRTLIAIGLILAAVGAAAQTAAPVSLALVRPDGILTPVAVFDGAKWIDPWPEPADPLTLDRMIEALPSYWRERREQVPQVWHVATPRSRLAVKVSVLTHVIVEAHCGHQPALLTDLPRRREDPHVKALAMDRVVPIVWPLDLSSTTPSRAGWQDLIEVVPGEVARQEIAAVTVWQQESGRASQLEPPDERKAVQIKKLYGHAEGGTRTLYYEAERRYAKSIWQVEGAEPSALMVTGWIVASGTSAPVALGAFADVGGPEFKGIISNKPLGILRLGGLPLWVMQQHGYESEAVTIISVAPGGLTHVYSKFIGGC